MDLLWIRYNCANFHHCIICVTDFREKGGLFGTPPSSFIPHPLHPSFKKVITNACSKSSNYTGFNLILPKFYEMICEIIVPKIKCGIFLLFCWSSLINTICPAVFLSDHAPACEDKVNLVTARKRIFKIFFQILKVKITIKLNKHRLIC